METIAFDYAFQFSDGQVKTFALKLRKDTLELVHDTSANHAWCALPFKKCSHCPLSDAEVKECPAARGLAFIADSFKDIKSFEMVKVTVTTRERTYLKELALQEGLHGIFGLVMATSGCPHMAPFRPMARFHLPFASLQETMVRVVSFYLLEQYFKAKKGESADFAVKDLDKVYRNVSIVNAGIIERIRAIAKGDADQNSIVILDSYAQMLMMQLSDGLEDLESIFSRSVS